MKKEFIAFVLLSSVTYAQDRAVSSFGELSGNDGKISYSIGLPDYVQLSGTDGAISQGVQQPFELFVNAVDEWNLNFLIEVFPNPASSSFSIKIGDGDKSNLSYAITDFAGKQIANGTISEIETLVDVSNLATASYMLLIKKGTDLVQSYKLIKN